MMSHLLTYGTQVFYNPRNTHSYISLIQSNYKHDSQISLQKKINMSYFTCDEPPIPTRIPIGGSKPKPQGRPFNSFILHFIKFSFSKVSRPESPARPEGRVRTGARFTPTFSFILSKNLFMSFRFKVFNYAEAFSNGRPINIYISQNAITMKAFYAF